MSIFEIFGLSAGIIQIAGYIWYVLYAVKGVVKPSPGSWIIWTYGNAIVCWNYIAVAQEFTFKLTLPIICSIACILSAIFFLIFKKFEKPSAFERKILFADILITLFWLITGENLIAQVLLQISVFISFVPIIKETRRDPSQERSGPWFLWTAAYLLLFLAEYSEGFWMWIYPIQYLVWHSIMGFLSQRSKSLVS